MASGSPHQRVILLIDDQECDTILIKRALEKAGLDYPVIAIHGGLQAIAYLNGDPPFSDRGRYPFPLLVLLDLHMPVVGGFEVLRQIRQKPEFAGVPVVMLTGDGQTAQAQRAYELGANSFFVKSLDFSNSADLFRSVQLLLTSRG